MNELAQASRAPKALPSLRAPRRGGCWEANSSPEERPRATPTGPPTVQRAGHNVRGSRRAPRRRSVAGLWMEMAGLFKIRTRLHLMTPSFGRALQREISARLWKTQDKYKSCWFKTHMFLQPQRWQPDTTVSRGKVLALPVCSVQRLALRQTWLAQYRCAGSLSHTNRVLEESMTEDKEQFKLVYRFPGIKYCRILSRMKLLQTALTIAFLPPVYHLYLQEQVSLDFLLYVTGIACFAAAMLYSLSYFLRRMIGLIYLNEAGTMAKVAHLTFWGRKKVIYCPVETVVTLGDSGDAKNEVLLQFKRHNSSQVLYFTLRFGQVVDKQRFAQIFGEFY
ncbi:transmembrane protein 186 [Carettochelys insculpta]|uniref:transmembrane protein 186 n=1 Tax=Carettochelys insculpta TaxID=44489 RepID=UPI003EBF93FE